MKKKIISLLTTLVIVVGLIGVMPVVSAGAASTTAFDILTTSKYAKTYVLKSSGTTIPYTNKNLSTRGTVTYGKSSTAYISNSSDELYLYDVGKTNNKYWAYVSYPISSSKRAYAYIYLSAITSNNGSHVKKTSTGKFYCSARSGSANNSSYYVVKGDTVYLISTSGNKYQIMYPMSNGKYRIAWCSKSDYDKYCLNKTTTSSSSTASGKLPEGIYLTQQGKTTCTLSSAAMMLRARKYLSGKSYSSITESSIKSTAWSNGVGLKYSWTYSGVSVSHKNVSGMSISSLKSLLNSHPEGIVLYCGKLPHAVFITDYSGDTFYCADPISSYSGKRIKLSASYLGKMYSNQSGVLKNVTAYWYVSKY